MLGYLHLSLLFPASFPIFLFASVHSVTKFPVNVKSWLLVYSPHVQIFHVSFEILLFSLVFWSLLFLLTVICARLCMLIYIVRILIVFVTLIFFINIYFPLLLFFFTLLSFIPSLFLLPLRFIYLVNAFIFILFSQIVHSLLFFISPLFFLSLFSLTFIFLSVHYYFPICSEYDNLVTMSYTNKPINSTTMNTYKREYQASKNALTQLMLSYHNITVSIYIVILYSCN